MIKWQLPTGDGLFEFGLLIGHTARSGKPFLPLSYPGLDVFWRVQGQVSSLDDDGFSRNRLGLVVRWGGIKSCM